MNKFFKICFISTFGLALLTAVPNLKVEQVEEKIETNGEKVTRGTITPPVHFTNYDKIYLDQQIEITLNYGSVVLYEFTPSQNGLYVVETNGNAYTSLCVESETFPRIFDSGANKDGKNSKIQFTGKTNKKVYIYARLDPKTGSSTSTIFDLNPIFVPATATDNVFNLLVRRAGFEIFTVDYGIGTNCINTVLDASAPLAYFSSRFDTHYHVNYDISTEESRKILNKEMIFFTGHGGPTFYNGTTEYNLNLGSIKDMTNTTLAFWSGCSTASFAESLVKKKNVKCSIGFSVTVDSLDCFNFTNMFYTKLAGGGSIKSALDFTKAMLPLSKCSRNVKAYGDTSIVVTANSVSNCTFNIPIESPLGPGFQTPIHK